MGIMKTGIQGLDAMLYGGIPEGDQVVLAGGPGAGKTLMAFEILYRNAKMGESGVYFSLEEDPQRVLQNAKSAFSELSDIDEMIEKKKLVIDGRAPTEKLAGSDPSGYEFGKVVSDIEDIVNQIHATRVVIDSASILSLLINDQVAYRRSMMQLITDMRRLNVTTILTMEAATPERSKLEFKPEFFIFDGIISMYQTGEAEKRTRAMEIIKMRGTKHSFVTTPYDITSAGFKVYSAEDASLY
ncbi:MAG: ATPase domain-containing protein [Candidatus Micrarchaeales archaeon]